MQLIEDRCPGVLRLHVAADGCLARVRLPGGRITADGLRAIADVAGLGNGLVELTSRASVQIRGLRDGDRAAAADRLSEVGLLPSPSHERVRNIMASPLGGRDVTALLRTDELVDALDRRLCALPRLAALPGRFLFAVDDGSGALRQDTGDVTLRAEADDAGEVALRLHLAGAPTTIAASPRAAAELALAAAHAFLTMLAERPVTGSRPAWRIADLPAADVERLARRLGGDMAHPPAGEPDDVEDSMRRHRHGTTMAPGVVEQVDGRRAVTALVPLGRTAGETIAALAELADDEQGSVRFSPSRTVSVVDVVPSRASRVAARLAGMGLVVDADSGWHGLSACAG
ncbi:MAG: nitrite reductase, partial [Actinomycetota bacterium]|nr:nitrite reductase [Actinomycetota bacterium]